MGGFFPPHDVEGRATPFLLLESFSNSLVSTLQKNWGGVSTVLPGLSATALTNPPRGTCPESSVPALGCQALGRDSRVWPCIQPLHKHMQPTLFKSLLPWCKPLTPLGPGTAQPPAFGFSPLNFGKSSPGASGACTWRNESFLILSRIEGSVSHRVQIPPGPPF